MKYKQKNKSGSSRDKTKPTKSWSKWQDPFFRNNKKNNLLKRKIYYNYK